MGFHHLIHIDFYTQPRFFRHLNQTAFDLKRFFGQALIAFLPNPVRINRGDFTRCSGGNMGKHRQGNIEVVV
ncbi:Uncharacterised protein [Shigella sonnei]|nr:Uncharacterised protein [Shigella sonnei]